MTKITENYMFKHTHKYYLIIIIFNYYWAFTSRVEYKKFKEKLKNGSSTYQQYL